jgi:NhaP-type Na+/H+ or K+/H+ antiporter
MGEQVGFGLLVGLAIGYVGGWLVMQAEKREWMSPTLAQLSLPALAILAWLTADLVGGNGFIAAFIAGLTVRVPYKKRPQPPPRYQMVQKTLINFRQFSPRV